MRTFFSEEKYCDLLVRIFEISEQGEKGLVIISTYIHAVSVDVERQLCLTR